MSFALRSPPFGSERQKLEDAKRKENEDRLQTLLGMRYRIGEEYQELRRSIAQIDGQLHGLGPGLLNESGQPSESARTAALERTQDEVNQEYERENKEVQKRLATLEDMQKNMQEAERLAGFGILQLLDMRKRIQELIQQADAIDEHTARLENIERAITSAKKNVERGHEQAEKARLAGEAKMRATEEAHLRAVEEAIGLTRRRNELYAKHGDPDVWFAKFEAELRLRRQGKEVRPEDRFPG